MGPVPVSGISEREADVPGIQLSSAPPEFLPAECRLEFCFWVNMGGNGEASHVRSCILGSFRALGDAKSKIIV